MAWTNVPDFHQASEAKRIAAQKKLRVASNVKNTVLLAPAAGVCLYKLCNLPSPAVTAKEEKLWAEEKNPSTYFSSYAEAHPAMHFLNNASDVTYAGLGTMFIAYMGIQAGRYAAKKT